MNRDEARRLDADDPLASYAARFCRPADSRDDKLAYLCGHSLGLAPAHAADRVHEALERWGRLGVEGHFGEGPSWYRYDEPLTAPMAELVGADARDVAVMGSLTTNLHLLLASFLRPHGERRAVLIEANAFPSDRYVAETQLRWHGLDPAVDLLEWPTDDRGLLGLDELDALLADHGHRIACALLGGVNFATGQRLDLGAVTARLHAVGALVGFDLAHAAGNVAVDLPASGADFAAWCSYKYLNGGPGAVAALHVAARHGDDLDRVRLGGWWGNDPDTRFDMDVERHFVPVPGAGGWRQSNPPILSLAPVAASLELFTEATMTALVSKSHALTGALADALSSLAGVRILTPADPERRGAQLSVRVADAVAVADRLRASGVVVDVRPPDILRMAPVPLYNSFDDVWRAADAMQRARR